MTVMAISGYKDNGYLILACVELGYLCKEWVTLDPTYGEGVFWKHWRPNTLVAHDLDPELSPSGVSIDATMLPYPDRHFDSVVIDGPYKLNGKPTEETDKRYGVHIPTRWQDRMQLLGKMLTEGARVLDGGFLLFKCQDQVCSGKVRWQTHVFTDLAVTLDLGLVDRLEFCSYRPQPDGTRQVTARRNSSTMLIFKRGWRS